MDPVRGHLRRHMGDRIRDALGGFRVVVLHGARQSGKTTLARLISEEFGGTYVTLENETMLRAALDDPAAFLTNWPKPLVVDEVQVAGDRLIKEVKRLVDEDQIPGRFLLTGSTNFLSVPTISESLAGRARILRLAPLSQAEIAGTATAPIDAWIARASRPDRNHDLERPEPLTRRDYADLICRGGYPEVLRLPSGLRSGWFESYVETVVGRDIVALADIRRSAALEPLLRWAAAQTAQEVNLRSVSMRLGISHPTVVAYLDWLRTVFLVHELPAWSRNLTSRAVRQPKLHVADTGLTAGLLSIDPESLASASSQAMGALAESFAVNEIARQATSAHTRMSLWHYRDARREVDLIIELPGGSVIAVEVKASSSPSPDGLRHLRWMRDRLDDTAPGCFVAGVLLHMGQHDLSFGDRLRMAPLSSLWSP